MPRQFAGEFVRDDDAGVRKLAHRLKPGGEIHRIADNGVFAMMFSRYDASDHVAVMNADRETEGFLAVAHPDLAPHIEKVGQLDRAFERSERGSGERQRKAEYSHDAIADEFVHDPITSRYGLRHPPPVFGEQGCDLLQRHRLGEPREASDIDEQYRRLLAAKTEIRTLGCQALSRLGSKEAGQVRPLARTCDRFLHQPPDVQYQNDLDRRDDSESRKPNARCLNFFRREAEDRPKPSFQIGIKTTAEEPRMTMSAKAATGPARMRMLACERSTNAITRLGVASASTKEEAGSRRCSAVK